MAHDSSQLVCVVLYDCSLFSGVKMRPARITKSSSRLLAGALLPLVARGISNATNMNQTAGRAASAWKPEPVAGFNRMCVHASSVMMIFSLSRQMRAHASMNATQLVQMLSVRSIYSGKFHKVWWIIPLVIASFFSERIFQRRRSSFKNAQYTRII
jgi:hypothetical protein